MAQYQCPIWETRCEAITHTEGSATVTESPRAGGDYQLHDDATAELGSLSNDEKARLTTALVRERLLGNPCPVVNLNAIEAAKRSSRAPMEERLKRLLRYLALEITQAGTPIGMGPDPSPLANTIPISEEDEANWRHAQYGLAYSESIGFEELDYLAESLSERGLVEKGHQIATPFAVYRVDNWGFLCRVTTKGYTEIEQLQAAHQSDQCFVAMWFNEKTNALYDSAIAPAVMAAGYQPIRIDRQTNFLGKIDDQIIAEIRRSRFVVADFTHDERGARGSVYYEAGFAHGLEIPVIFTCRDDQIDDLHFDTNHFLHLAWPATDPGLLIEPLTNRILANIGPGPHNGDGR